MTTTQGTTTGDELDVKVTFTVRISRSAWEANYGVTGTAAIRQDVKQYVEEGARQQLSSLGLLAE